MVGLLPDNQDPWIEQERLFYAHSANACGQWHRLSDHLRAVANLASRFAGNSPWAQEAALAGLLQDLGKYADRFQARLAGKDSGLDHWSQGAWVALSQSRAIAAALHRHQGNKLAAARALGISRATLYARLMENPE